MKKIYILILVLFSMSVQAQKYYYNGSEKVQLYQSEKSFILFEESKETVLKGFEKAETYKVKNFTILKNKTSDFSMAKTFEKKSGEISPAYTIEKNGNFELYPTKTVRVKLLPNKSKKDISKLINENSIFQIKEKYGIIRIKVYNINAVFDIANKIYESGIAEFSLPDFYIEKEVNQVNDPLYPQQYQMNNTGQVVDGIAGVNDIDSNALEAWDINLGDNITVAIIDQGLEAHEDIGDRLIGGHTPLNNGNGQPIANDDTHGMSCAGVLAASDNNLGVRGVAPNVNLLSVNIFAGGETAGDIADGITWAVNNGADIISNSWSLSNVPCGFTNADIDNAIQDAVTRGRNQRGCVVVFSSGNDNTFQGGCVDYPATNPNVISVGAIDNRGNLYGYSRRGPELDLVAPSGLRFFVPGETTVGVRTLDRMGTAGDFAGNYRDDFDGTSAACPVVSGVAALVLSRYPNLSQNEVRNILNQSATDMGAAGFDNNSGNGRVNALAALQLADDLAPTRRIIGPTQLTPGLRATYSLSAPNPDATHYNWIIPSGCYYNYCWEIINGQGTTSLSISAGKTGIQNIECKVYNGSSLIESRYITVNVQNPYNGGGGGGDDPCGGVPNVIYPPNPCNDVANVNSTSERLYFRKIVVYNFQGQKILEVNNSQSLDISHLNSGIYIIKAELSNNEIMTKKIFKE